MKGKLVALAVGLGVVAGAAQFSGEWSTVLVWKSWPPPGAFTVERTTLRLEYKTGVWTLDSVSAYSDPTGWTDQAFGLKGELGPFALTGKAWFDPAAPACLAAEGILGITFGESTSAPPPATGRTGTTCGRTGTRKGPRVPRTWRPGSSTS